MKLILFYIFHIMPLCRDPSTRHLDGKSHFGRVEISQDRWWMGENQGTSLVNYVLKMGVTSVFVVYFRS